MLAATTLVLAFCLVDHTGDIQTIDAFPHVRALKGAEEVSDESAKLGIGWSGHLDRFDIFFGLLAAAATVFVDLSHASLSVMARHHAVR